MIIPDFDVSPYRLSGVVHGALLNDAAELAAMGEAVEAAPHRGAPRRPVLSLRPRAMLQAASACLPVSIAVPADPGRVHIGVTLGAVIGATACRVGADRALEHVAGYLVAGEIWLPHESRYRPAVRQRARDGFCPLGMQVVPATQIADPDALATRVEIDGRVAQQASTGPRVRPLAPLIADLSAFMTLQPGDVLLGGCSFEAPLAHIGQQVRLTIDGVGTIAVRLDEEVFA